MINYIRDLWYGKIKLYMVFWMYDMVIGTLVYMFTLERYSSINNFKSFMGFLIFCIYCIFINKALWSSATNYKEKWIWSLLVKIIVVLDLIWLTILLPLRLFDPINFEKITIILGVSTW